MVHSKTSLDEILRARTIIPRWKSPQEAIETSISNPVQLRRRDELGNSWVRHLTTTFERMPSSQTANELYETALLYGRTSHLSDAIVELSKQKRNIGSSATTVPSSHDSLSPQTYLSLDHAAEEQEKSARLQIRNLRRMLAEDSNRPLCWSELARYFLIVAEPSKATRCMQTALQLAKHNRYLCRAATRLFVHIREPDRALSLLRNQPSIKDDPWLLAAEIATSSISSKRSLFLDAAKRLMISHHFKESQLTELESAIGTVELIHGAAKRAKKLFERSLIEPNENSLAQAQWAVGQDSKIVIPTAAWKTPASYEARALVCRQEHQWERALKACAGWLSDEPFSIRPALMGSYLGFRPEHWAIAEQFATAGLRCNNANTILLNNRAVARTRQGKLEEAYTDVKAALEQESARDDPHIMATLGLIAFRSGMPILGREFYEKSIAWFSQAENHPSVALALLYLSLEEIRIDRSFIPRTMDLIQSIEKSSAVKYPEVVGIIALVHETAKTVSGNWMEKVPDGNSQVKPASSDEFKHLASLIHFPAKASQFLPASR